MKMKFDPRIRLVRYFLKVADAPRLAFQQFHYPEVTIMKNVGGSEKSDKAYLFDLYLPVKKEKACPLVIDLHGGGLVYGSMELNQWTAAEMAVRGYAVAVLDYPLIPQATVTEQIQVILSSLARLEQLPVDIDWERVYLKGDSAGGLLCLLLLGVLTTGKGESAPLFNIRHSFRIRAVSLIHPMVRTRRTDILNFIPHYLGCSRQSESNPLGQNPFSQQSLQTQVIREKSGQLTDFMTDPLQLIPQLPPVWLATSGNDVMFHREGIDFAQKIKQANIKLRLHDYPFRIRKPLNHIFMVTQPQRKESQDLYDSMDQFFRTSEG